MQQRFEKNAAENNGDESVFETQMFGDRLNVAVNDYEQDYKVVEELLNKSNIKLTDHRIIPTSLENVFIHLINEDKAKN